MRILLTAFALALLALAVAAPAQRPFTKAQIRTEPPEQTHRRLRDQFWRLFEVEDMRREDPPRRALDRVRMRTEPGGTEIPSLCRLDTLTIEFAPLRGRARPVDRPRGADTLVRPTGFSSTSYYRFLSPPQAVYHQAADYQRVPEDEPLCRRLSLDRQPFFIGDSPRVANDGYLAFLRLQQALRESADVPLECDLFPVERSVACADVITAIEPDQINEVQQCDSRSSDGAWCYRVFAASRMIDLFVSVSTPGPPFGTVLGARLSSLIVLSHPRVD